MRVEQQVRNIVICDCGGFIIPEIVNNEPVAYYCIECKETYSIDEYKDFSTNNVNY